MNLKLLEKLENELQNIVKNEGFDIEYIEFVKEQIGNVFRVVLDKENGTVSVDDCENISRKIEDIVDKEIKEEYVLEVSSPGLERNLKNIKLYKKYIGYNIFVKLYKRAEFGKEFEAVLKSVDMENNNITLIISGKEYVVSVADIASAHTVYDFNKVLKESKDNVNINELKKF